MNPDPERSAMSRVYQTRDHSSGQQVRRASRLIQGLRLRASCLCARAQIAGLPWPPHPQMSNPRANVDDHSRPFTEPSAVARAVVFLTSLSLPRVQGLTP